MRWERRAGAASVPGRDVPCASCALEPEKGTLSEQRAAPQQPLRLLHQCASWGRLSLQYVNATVNAVPQSFPEQTVAMGQRIPSRTGTSGEEGLDWLNWWRQVAWCQLLGAVGNQKNVGLWDGTSCFSRPPEPCPGGAALRAGRSFWLREMALQSCHGLWQCLLGGQCQAWRMHPIWARVVMAATFRAAGFRTKLLVSGKHKHMVHVASTSGDVGRESHERYSCDDPAMLPGGFSCQSQCRRSSRDNHGCRCVPAL